MRNILVTGANGQLGNELRLVARGSEDRYIFTDIAEESPESIAMIEVLAGKDPSRPSPQTGTRKLDITNLDDIRAIVKEENISVVINCAAFTNVDAAEDNEPLAELLNAKAVENLAIAMKEVGGHIVHISTDYVFGGDPYNTPCREDQKGTPTGVYGKTKLHGEEAILNVGCSYNIIRTAWLYSEFGKNFVKTMLNLTASKPSLKVVFDQVGTPTYAGDLAKVIYRIVSSGEGEKNPGVYHFSNEGVCSWFDFTKMIAEYSGHTSCDIQPCHSDEFPSKVKRPSFSVLDKTKIKSTFGINVPYWTDSLKPCIEVLVSSSK